ncbi:DNA mismatch repair protein [Flavitalea sp. BT771]|uniref:MutS-related protein n=1 Tax=Flavitalea sp. BT771 TaxID=3063329 RepID=UPI0026E21296|nr:DNA mismatch repair protein [Flavitalea sp. BT771]MDO6433158.1 DNA mismatch repair protein [Flavitalea sp. BT771]MDV6221566.1 DNA mismatch repair protein [Flavitalea sp. BT771]
MSFTVDKQTLDDLNLTGRYKPDSIFSLFNRVNTAGGEKRLDALFNAPLRDAGEINKRSGLFQYFQRKALAFPLAGTDLTEMEGYLSAGRGSGLLGVVVDTGRKKLMDMILRDEGFSKIKEGLGASVRVLKALYALVCGLEEDAPFGERVCEVKTIFHDRRLTWLRSVDVQGLSWWRVARYDHVLRSLLHTEMETLMEIIYEVDVYIAVAEVAAAKGFCYAEALPAEGGVVRVQGVRHPRLDKGLGNTVTLSSLQNMLFLTGANMAGKSTLMKSIGIAVYLAHMGFPVAADEMTFSVRDGLYTSINVPDDLSLGHSHFYAEVLRVKKVAQEVALGKDLVVIFDELFKGTNVKDAYDATLAVTRELAEYRDCFFIISTHIIEVGEALREGGDNIRFVYLPTVMEGMTPRYTYVLKEGITADRHGMMIIENEGVVGMIGGRH